MAGLAGLLGESHAIDAVREQVRQLLGREAHARRLPTILLQGETGTGKGLLARLIHEEGARRVGPLVDVNCAAIPDALLEAELFGFERGAFTDARQAKPGLFQTAHGGTLFLDEIGLLPDPLQAKLLKVIDERGVRRLGSTRTEAVDARIIAASNDDLAAAVRARRFREDLFHRLAVVTVTLPPLRERQDDILLLAQHFLARSCADYRLPPKTFAAAALAALGTYGWPGNVRELSNVIERVALLSEGQVIDVDLLQLPAARSTGRAPIAVPPGAGFFDQTVSDVERGQVLEALEATRWNVTRAALRLGISRDRLRYRISRLGLGLGGSTGRRQGRHQRALEPPHAEPVPLRMDETVPPGVRWEQRYIAVLRADLSSSAGSEDMPYASRAVTTVISKLQSFGGRVRDAGRTTVVAAFGLDPVDSAPTSAALAAVAIQHAATRAQQMEPRAPTVKLAIHVDRLMVAHIGGTPEIDLEGKQQAWAMLEALVRAGNPGEILVSQAAAPFLGRRFELQPTDATEGSPSQYNRLVQGERTGFGLAGKPLTPFVGREREIALLAELLTSAERGHRQMVAITGEPGVGKSRVVYQLSRSRRLQGWRVLSCGGVPYGRTTPWLPVGDGLKRYFQLNEADSPSEAEKKISARLSTLNEAASRAPILALLGLPLEDSGWIALDPPQRRQRMIEAVTRVLRRASQVQPLLLIIEDLHWVDGETFGLLDRLIESLPARMLLLLTYRPEFRHDWGTKAFYTQIALGPLPPENAAALLDALLGRAPGLDALRRLLIDRTDGNPFFLEECVQTLIGSGTLVGERGTWRLAGPIEALHVPATVQAVLRARIDRLSLDQKRLLETAAVIGKDVRFVLLQAVSDLTEEALRAMLRDLQAAEFLYETGLSPDLEYTFKHALTHEVAYASLPEERRRLMHARITEAIERICADRLGEHVERLGQHAFRGQVWDKAVRYLQEAAAKAFERCANREASACLEQALDALRHLPETRGALEQAIDLRFDLRNPLTALGELEKLHDHLQQAERLAATLGDQHRLGRVASYQCSLFVLSGEYTRGVDFGERALAVGNALDDLGIQAVANIYISMARFSLGDYTGAVESLTRTTESLKGDLNRKRFGLTLPPAVLAQGWKAFCLSLLGRFADAISCGEEAVEIAEAVAHAYCRAEAMLHAGRTHLLRGDLDRASRLLEESVALCRATGIRLTFPMAAAWLGQAHVLAGRLPEGLALLAEAVDVAESMTHGFNQSLFVGLLGEACLLAGRLDDAITHAGHALELSRRRNERGLEAVTLRLLGEIHSHHDALNAGQAEGSYRQAMTRAAELCMRPLVAHCHLGLGKLYRRTGKRERAQEHVTTATTMYREMDMMYWLEKAEAEIRELS